VIQSDAERRRVLQSVAVCRCVLQCVAVYYSQPMGASYGVAAKGAPVDLEILPVYVAVCCNVLQSFAVCCRVLQCDAVCCSMMECVGAV